MDQIMLDSEAGNLSAELSRRGVATDARVHAVVEILDAGAMPMATLAQAGKAFEWLDEEPDIYSDADLVECAS